MSQSRPRTISFVLLAVVLLTGSLSASMAFAEEASHRGLFVHHDFDAAPGKVRDFWSRARMRSALPIPEVGATPQFRSDGWATAVRSQELEASRSSLLQEAPFERREITDPTVFPYRVHGKLFVRAGRAAYFCSATVLRSENESVVFTAAHCLYGDDLGGWADSVAFVPGYRFGGRPFGTWVAASAFVAPVWKSEQSARGDIGALVMEPLGGESIVDAVGGRWIAFDEERQQRFEAFGYPQVGDFDGERLYVCTADAFARDTSPSGTGPDPTGIGCDMTQGSSGGGWVINGAALNSVNSYGYQDEDGKDLPYMFGPYFASMARALYDQAESVEVEIPEPVPSASVTPTDEPTTVPPAPAEPSSEPSPSPTEPAPRFQSISDADDSRGPFDISEVAVTESAGRVTVDLTTHDTWGARLLSDSYPRNLFFVDFDTVGDETEDLYLAVRSRYGRLVGRIHAYGPGRDPVVGRAWVLKTSRDSFTAVVQGSVLQLESRLGWYASSHFKSRNRCSNGCRDFAPNRTMVQM